MLAPFCQQTRPVSGCIVLGPPSTLLSVPPSVVYQPKWNHKISWSLQDWLFQERVKYREGLKCHQNNNRISIAIQQFSWYVFVIELIGTYITNMMTPFQQCCHLHTEAPSFYRGACCMIIVNKLVTSLNKFYVYFPYGGLGLGLQIVFCATIHVLPCCWREWSATKVIWSKAQCWVPCVVGY